MFKKSTPVPALGLLDIASVQSSLLHFWLLTNLSSLHSSVSVMLSCSASFSSYSSSIVLRFSSFIILSCLASFSSYSYSIILKFSSFIILSSSLLLISILSVFASFSSSLSVMYIPLSSEYYLLSILSSSLFFLLIFFTG